jgi:hypothetical protein
MTQSLTRGRNKPTSNRKAKTKRTSQKTAQRTAAKARDRVAVETVRGTVATFTELNPFRENAGKARDLLEGSRSTLQAVVESWQKTFGAAGQSAVALNRKMIDITERNLETSFDFALRLARARSLREAMELQAAYWGNLVGDQPSSPKARSSSRKR